MRFVSLGRLAATLPVCALAFGLAACSANHKSIFRYQPVATETASYALIDAKQRAIIAAPREITTTRVGAGEPETTTSGMVVCAEPSPDVFSVIAQSASGSGTLGKSADPTALNIGASFAASSSEQGSTLARTQTVNMLRELMYRTCERYMNKGISSLELPIQAIRDQRLMVSILAVEQLTAAATPRVVTIGASGTAAGGSSVQDAVAKVSAAHDDLTKAQADLATKQEAVTKIKDACAAIDTKVASKETLTAEETTQQQACIKAKGALTDAQAKVKDAGDHYALLQRVATQGGGGPVSATTTVSGATSADGQAAQAAALAAVAGAVEDITKMNYDQDEILMVCLKTISAEDTTVTKEARDRVNDTCARYVNSIIDARAAASERAALEDRQAVAAAKITIARTDNSKFGRFWSKILAAKDGESVDPTKLAEVIDGYLKPAGKKAGTPDVLERMKLMTKREDLAAAFPTLATSAQKALAQ